MTYTRLPYDDAASTAEMAHDCLAAGSNLAHATALAPRPQGRHAVPLVSGSAAGGGLEVSDSLAELAAGLHLHFD